MFCIPACLAGAGCKSRLESRICSKKVSPQNLFLTVFSGHAAERPSPVKTIDAAHHDSSSDNTNIAKRLVPSPGLLDGGDTAGERVALLNWTERSWSKRSQLQRARGGWLLRLCCNCNSSTAHQGFPNKAACTVQFVYSKCGGLFCTIFVRAVFVCTSYFCRSPH